MDNKEKIRHLTQLGEAAFGSHWKSEFSTHLGVAERTVRYWASGERGVPDTVIRSLLSYLHARSALLIRAARDVANECRGEDGYVQIMWKQNFHPSVWILDPDCRDYKTMDWYDIDGELYGLTDRDAVIDINGRSELLPGIITPEELRAAKQKQLDDELDY